MNTFSIASLDIFRTSLDMAVLLKKVKKSQEFNFLN